MNSPENLSEKITSFGFKWLPIDPAHIDVLELLPNIHKDPFDRIIVAQARFTFMTLMTLDKKFSEYL